MIPGFVDGHTHPVFDGDRANEFSMKLAGASYMEIHEKGGGIHYTVDRKEIPYTVIESYFSPQKHEIARKKSSQNCAFVD